MPPTDFDTLRRNAYARLCQVIAAALIRAKMCNVKVVSIELAKLAVLEANTSLINICCDVLLLLFFFSKQLLRSATFPRRFLLFRLPFMLSVVV